VRQNDHSVGDKFWIRVHAMKSRWSSRERMQAALACEIGQGGVPCAFMLYGGLKSRCASYQEFVERQVELGLDTVVELPPRPPRVVNDWYNLHGLPVSYDPRVTIHERVVHMAGERHPVMVKEYHTPAGVLTSEVWQTEDWRWGDHVPFLDDYITPRARKFVLGPQASEADLAALGYLLTPPTEAEIQTFRAESEPAKELARENGLLLSGGWGVGADLLGWIYGLENMIYASYDRPEFLEQVLRQVAAWNRRRMEVVLEAGIDLYIKRAWYENCDFWSPRAWKKFIAPILKSDVALAHEAGARFGYIITSSCMPLLEPLAECGVDVLIGVDPHTWELSAAKAKLAGRVCLWGGVNGHLTVENGKPEAVRAEVRQAMDVLGEGGGFILSPVDNVREDTPRARENIRALIEEWKRIVGD
jgi:hypothetical protein